jgi:hypothetical protein
VWCGRLITEVGPDTSSSRTSRVNVADVLDGYGRALALATEPPPSIRLPARRLVAPARALHLALRPRLGVRYWVERDIRRRVDALDRGLARHLALAPAGDECPLSDTEDRERVRQFRESLPGAISPLVIATFIVTFLLLAQLLLAALPTIVVERVGGRLRTAFEEIGPSPGVTSAKDLADAAAHADQVELIVFVIAVSVAAYAVLRLPAGGYRLALLALGRDAGSRLLRRDSELDRARREMRIGDDDASAFAILGVASLPAFPLDLGVKATLWAPILLAGAEDVRYAVDSSLAVDGDLTGALLILAVALARYALLFRAGRRRGNTMMWLCLAVAIVVIAGLSVQLAPSAR